MSQARADTIGRVPRILQVFEPADGGVPEHVGVISAALAKRGWQVEIAGPPKANAYAHLEGLGVPIHEIPVGPGFGRPIHDLAQTRRLLGVMRGSRFDVVHCHSAKAGVLARLTGALARTPVVYSPHCFPFEGDSLSRRRIAFSLSVERALAPLASRIICVCEHERKLAIARRVASPERLALIPYGCAPCEHPGDPDPELAAFAGQGPAAAVIAAMRPQKSIDVFLEAAPLVLERVPGARLALVGSGPERDALLERAENLGLLDDRRFAHFDFRPPSARYLRAIDLFVLPSAWEALPIGILEALACGVPQVATNVGGTGEAVAPETGVMVPSRDPAALAGAIAELLNDPERRRKMGFASRARHAEHFGIATMTDSTIALYEELIG